jgi:ribosomal silencing factor RsfS
MERLGCVLFFSASYRELFIALRCTAVCQMAETFVINCSGSSHSMVPALAAHLLQEYCHGGIKH